MSLISIILLLGVIGVLATIGARLIPVYINYYNVRSIMQEVAKSPGIGNKNFSQVFYAIQTRLTINNINSVTEKDISMKTVGNQTTLAVKYTVETPLLGNVDALVHFDYSVHYKNTRNQ
ncbi:DUF4845 domain-containing protein [Acidihalobacter ferrooxydans]|uniref:DUF4845 domain-containing protein n=1 Tax=Acidihalobacter ferrooxydans TaxID=1765967 RepID=A0A1P8UHK2_9GAMM|nr:DUF4845 domain-containing protein [Acidihalobacter ferrooxydans]APZ43316.1 hypothetical protein BW247_09575 [Acidihalobacter ferrooxydans]